MIKVYTLTIAYNNTTEEVEYISEEVVDEDDNISNYGTLDINKKEFWDSISSDKAIEIMKEIAES